MAKKEEVEVLATVEMRMPISRWCELERELAGLCQEYAVDQEWKWEIKEG